MNKYSVVRNLVKDIYDKEGGLAIWIKRKHRQFWFLVYVYLILLTSWVYEISRGCERFLSYTMVNIEQGENSHGN